jgi:flavorubredoxin
MNSRNSLVCSAIGGQKAKDRNNKKHVHDVNDYINVVKIWWDKCIDRDLERQKKELEEKGSGENSNLIVRSEVSIIDFAMIMIGN